MFKSEIRQTSAMDVRFLQLDGPGPAMRPGKELILTRSTKIPSIMFKPTITSTFSIPCYRILITLTMSITILAASLTDTILHFLTLPGIRIVEESSDTFITPGTRIRVHASTLLLRFQAVFKSVLITVGAGRGADLHLVFE